MKARIISLTMVIGLLVSMPGLSFSQNLSQDQLNLLSPPVGATPGSHPDGFYMVTGIFDPLTVNYDSDQDATTISFEIDPLNEDIGTANANPNTWRSNSSKGQSAYFVEAKHTNANVIQVMDAVITSGGIDDGNGNKIVDTSNNPVAYGTITVKGQFTPEAVALDKNTFGIFYENSENYQGVSSTSTSVGSEKTKIVGRNQKVSRSQS